MNNQPRKANTNSSVLKPLTKKRSKNVLVLVIVFSLLVVLAGVATGWFLSGGTTSGKSGLADTNGKAVPGVDKNNGEVGFDDDTAFPDEAEGVLEKGGIEGEGTHHLVREGGETQYVYVTSTVIDLGSLVGKKVQIWGETIAARNAPWLMDVGRVKILD